MKTITKSIIFASALVSAGVLTAFGLAVTRAEGESAAIQVAQRFPLASEMFSPVPVSSLPVYQLEPKPDAIGSKADKLTVPADACSLRDWPSISKGCLVALDLNPMRRVNRVITVERRLGENTSELMRIAVTDMANR